MCEWSLWLSDARIIVHRVVALIAEDESTKIKWRLLHVSQHHPSAKLSESLPISQGERVKSEKTYHWHD